jgi:hypothetical protein
MSEIAERLRQLLSEMELWAADPTAAFDQVAEAFYRETGVMAPGKSVPLEMGAMWTDEERQRRYAAWHLQRRETRHQTIREAIGLLESR